MFSQASPTSRSKTLTKKKSTKKRDVSCRSLDSSEKEHLENIQQFKKKVRRVRTRRFFLKAVRTMVTIGVGFGPGRELVLNAEPLVRDNESEQQSAEASEGKEAVFFQGWQHDTAVESWRVSILAHKSLDLDRKSKL